MTDLSQPPTEALPPAAGRPPVPWDAPLAGRAELLEAIEQQSRRPPVRIGEALLALGLIDERALGDALQQQTQDRSRPLGELLVQRGLVSRDDLQRALAQRMGFPLVDVSAFPTEREAAHRVPATVARRLQALPLLLQDERMVVALEDPSARIVIDELEAAADCAVVPVLATAGALGPAIDRLYADPLPRASPMVGLHTLGPAGSALDDPRATGEEPATLPPAAAPDSVPDARQIQHQLDAWLRAAHAAGATALHVECPAAPAPLRVRQRLAGRLQPVDEVPATWGAAVTSRLKQLAALDLAEHRRPQSARVDLPGLATGAQVLRVQVTTLPTADGTEDLVLRLSTPPRLRPLAALGLPAAVMAAWMAALDGRGLVLCCGLPGSGLTTLLHAALGHLSHPARSLWSVQSPPEINQPGVRHLQLTPRLDQAAARAVQALAQADADVVMVDLPTDDDALREACALARTGPLVLAAVHATDAAQAWARLLACGVDLPLLQQVWRGTLVLATAGPASFVAAAPQQASARVICG